MKTRKLSILGATGSIGDNTLQVVRGNRDRLSVVGIAGRKNYEKLAAIAREFGVKHVGIFDESAWEAARRSGIFGNGVNLYCGEEGLSRVATLDEADTAVAAVVGTKALMPTLAAIEAGKDIALANKELLVMAGKFVMEASERKKVDILPLDSEHNAIFQCMNADRKRKDVAKLLITASGGMFRDYTREQMLSITPQQALKHPNWSMGAKVTIDSSTLANKGLEVIEARWLFDMDADRIQVVVQKQSIIHSMVQFVDGSVLAHLSPPSMTFAISHSLLCPDRGNWVFEPLDFSKPLQLDFSPPDTERFPCLKYAYDALRAGGTATAIFNASNEVAVEAFLKERLPWIKISEVVGKTLESIPATDPDSIGEVLAADAQARAKAAEICARV